MTHPGDMPCTPIQAAYIIGSGPDQPLGGQDCLGYVEFSGRALEPEALKVAIRALRRHPALRSRLVATHTLREGDIDLPDLVVHDLRDVHDVMVALEETRQRLVSHNFDLSQGDSWQIELSLLPDGTAHLHVLVSLVASDLAGIGRMMADLAATLSGQDLDHHTVAELLSSLRQPVHNPNRRAPDSRRELLLPAPELPLTGSEPTAHTERYEWLVDGGRWNQLDVVARQLGVTTTALVLGIYEESLRRWSATEDFIVTVTGVDTRGTEDHVADRTRTYAHRAISAPDLATLADETANELRHRLRRGVEATQELREALRAGTHAGLSPYVFTYAPKTELFPAEVTAVLGDVAVVRSSTPQTIIDCQVIRHSARGVTVSFDVRGGVLADGVAEQLFESFSRSLDILMDSGSEGGTLPALADLVPLPAATETARRKINTTPGYSDQLLHGAFFALAAKQPDRIALLWEPEHHPNWSNGQLTYGALSERALELAGRLHQFVSPGSVVGVRLPKGPDQVIAVLAVLAAGCAYLPLGVDQPQARVDHVREVSGMAALIDADFLGAEPTTTAAPLPLPLGDPQDHAYIIYTSGSTGTPKGVVIRHEAAANTVLDVNRRNNVGESDRTLAVSALDFDLSVYDLFGPLSAGGAVVLIDEESRRDAFCWVHLVTSHRVTVWNTVPSLVEMLCVAASEKLPLRRVFASGDWIDLRLPTRLQEVAPQAALVAMGGATEGSIWSNEFVVHAPTDVDPSWPSIPYGVPLSGHRYRVADPAGHDRPDGVPGELWIGGLGVAQGYHGAPELTAERFVEHAGERWYRTGDQGIWRPGPLLFFLGRNDAQVKVRGHRIECGEVEHALRTLPGVHDAVVVPIRDRSALGAVLVGEEGLATPPETDALAKKLPHYMIPSVFVRVDALKLTQNGKVDRRWACELLEDGVTPGGLQAGGRVAEMWAETLGRGGQRSDENFFSLGGDSLRATHLCARLREQGIDVSVADLFASPRLDEFERLCANRTGGVEAAVAPEELESDGRFPLSPLQRAYAMGRDGVHGIVQAPTAFMAVAATSTGTNVDVNRLAAHVTALIEELEGLRCRRVDELHQEVLPPQAVQVRRVSGALEDALCHPPTDENNAVIELLIADRGDRIGIRVDYLGLDARSITTILTCLFDDLSALGRRLEVEPHLRQFRQYVRETSAGERPRDPQRSSEDLAAAPALVHDTPHGPVRPASKEWVLDAASVEELRHRAHAAGVTVSALALHALGVSLGRHTNQERMGVTVPVSFRPSGLGPEVLGNFTELALCSVGPAMSPQEVHKELGQATALTAPGERAIARAGRAAYPVVFTSTLGLTDGAVGTSELDIVWTRTSTPGVLIDCQIEERGTAIHIRLDYPEGTVTDRVIETILNGLVNELCGEMPAMESVPDSFAQSKTDSEVNPRALIREVVRLIDSQELPVTPHLAQVARRWRAYADAVPTRAASLSRLEDDDARLLADCFLGRERATRLLEHPRLSPQRLLLQTPEFTVPMSQAVGLMSGLPVGATVVELGTGVGLFRETLLRAVGRGQEDLNWVAVEADSLLRDIATDRGVPVVSSYVGSADLVLACASLHRDSRLLQGLTGISAPRCWFAEVPQLTSIGLLSAALIDPSLVDSGSSLRDVLWWWNYLEGAGWRPTQVDASSPGLFTLTAEAGSDRVAPVRTEPAGTGRQHSADEWQSENVRNLVAQSWMRHLGVKEVSAQDDFFHLGGDSLAATKILADLRAAGFDARLVDVFNHPTLVEFVEVVERAERASVASSFRLSEKAGSSEAEGDASRAYALTLVQQAYLAGRTTDQILGGVSAHCYYEFYTENFDAEHFASCVADVARRHPALRTVIEFSDDGADGRVLALTRDDIGPRVEEHDDPRGATRAEVVDLSEHAPMVVRWRGTSAGGGVVGIGLENVFLDGASMLQALREVGERYSGQVEIGLPGPTGSFASYIHDRPWLTGDAPSDEEQRVRLGVDTAYWEEVLQELPPAPPLTSRDAVLSLRQLSFERAAVSVPTQDWQRATRVAAESGITSAALVLTCYATALSALSGAQALTVNVTRFDRDPRVPDVPHILGDFTTLVPVGVKVEGASPADVLRTARATRDALASAAEHDRLGTLWVQRRLIQQTGDPYAALLPVVFTCGLGLTGTDENLNNFGFGELTYAASQTPQTLLDVQVSADSRGLHLSADYVSELLNGAEIEGLLNSMAQLISGLGQDPDAEVPQAAPGAKAENPMSATGDHIARIWAETLDGQRIEANTNFFTAGGDSLRATKCVRRLQEEVHPDINLRLLLTTPNYSSFAAAVAELITNSVVGGVGGTDLEEGSL